MRTFDYKPVLFDREEFTEMAREEFKEFQSAAKIKAEVKVQADAMVIEAEAKVEKGGITGWVEANGRRTSSIKPEQPSSLADAPRWAPFLLACVAKSGREDEILGDAESVYRQMIPRLGLTRARWYYGVYVLKLAGRMLPSVIMRVMLLHKLIGLLGL